MDLTPNRNYPIVNTTEKMRTEGWPKLISFANMVDADVAGLLTAVAGKQAQAARLDAIVASGVTLAMMATNVADTDGTLAANSDTRFATQKAAKTYADAVKTYAESLFAANDALLYKGAIDASANPNYPAADAGHMYRISVAGKIGGASGVNVEVGDTLTCFVDSTAAGNQAAVGASWNIVQANIDGAVIGPGSSVAGNIATFNSTTGKLISDSGYKIGTSGANTIGLLNTANTWGAAQVFTADVSRSAAVGTVRAIRFQTAGSDRWNQGANSGAEVGANAGSDYFIAAWSDAGAFLGNAMEIVRSTRAVNFPVSAAINADPIMTRGATETVSGAKTFSADVLVSKAGAKVTVTSTTSADPGYIFNTSGGRQDRMIATSGGWYLGVNVGASEKVFIMNTSGLLRASGYGAGTLVTDSSGNITASSDERLKTDIEPFTRGLADMLKMDGPISYRWNELSGMETKGRYVGFGARGARKGVPEAAGKDPRGKLTLYDRPIIATHHNAILELHARIAKLEKRKAA